MHTDGGPAAAGTAITPTGAGERVDAIDVLRGVALLGIFPVNVFTGFGLPMAAMYVPTVAGGYDGLDRAAHWLMHVGFELKMMTIFAALFGAGVLLQTRRQERAGRSAAGLYYRRLAWLALFGLIHAYGFWFGDILFMYALCATVMYPARRLSPKVLIAIGSALLFIGLAIFLALGGLMMLGAASEQGRQQMLASLDGTPELVAREVALRTGSIGEMFWWNVPEALFMHLGVTPLFGVWRVVGLMMIGAALLKLDVLTGRRSTRFYVIGAAVGYVLGLPLVVAGLGYAEWKGFDVAHSFIVWSPANYVGSLLMAFAHMCVVMLACRAGWAAGAFGLIKRGLAAVGRMAFTNYFMQTATGLLVFTGWGLAWMGSVSRVGLWGVVVGVWVVQMLVSTLWLRRLSIGPMEWVWRSLTYMRVQPWRRGE